MQRTGFIGIVTAAIALTLAGPAAQPARAFGLSGVGFRGGFADPEDLDGTFILGGHLEFEEHGSHLHLQPNVLFWSTDEVSDINPNFDLYYHFGPAGKASPFLGTGFGIHFMSVDLPHGEDDDQTNAGLNIFGGVVFPGRSVNFFLEGRAALTEWDTTSITAGVTFPVGH